MKLSVFILLLCLHVIAIAEPGHKKHGAKEIKLGVGFKWEVLMIKDLNTFLAIVIFTGLVTASHRSDYFRKYNFSFPRSRDQFEAILWSLLRNHKRWRK